MREELDEIRKKVNDVYTLVVQFQASGENNIFIAYNSIAILKDIQNNISKMIDSFSDANSEIENK